jgi:hypothetical protein
MPGKKLVAQRTREDPIEEIREIRRRISERFGHDPQRLGEHYIEYQKKFADRLISKRELDERKEKPAA